MALAAKSGRGMLAALLPGQTARTGGRPVPSGLCRGTLGGAAGSGLQCAELSKEQTPDMYESHFGITRSPFQLTPDPWFYFDSRGHHLAFAALRQGCGAGEAFVVLSGEIGSGKSMLVRSRLDEFDGSVVVAYLASTQLTCDELRRAVASAFGIPLVKQPIAAWEREFAGLLASLRADGRRAVLIIDEAQHLDPQGLAMLEALAPRFPQELPRLEIWLIGQPELRQLIAAPALDAFRDRIGVSCHLAPLEPPETQAYIEHRLGKVGWAGLPCFEAGAFEAIHRCTGGLPRPINRLCNRLLLGSFLSSSTTIDAETVSRTANDLQLEMEGRESEIGAQAEAPAAPAEAAPDTAGAGTASLPGASESVTAGAEPQRTRLLCVVGGQGDHIRAAALMNAVSRCGEPMVCTLVRAYRNDALRLHGELFQGLESQGGCVELDIAANAQAVRTAEVTDRLERLLKRCSPCVAVVFDGSELALACAVVASKLGIPVAHVGAGVRLLERTPTSDLTRALTDRLASVLYTPDAAAGQNLRLEGKAANRMQCVGSIASDALAIARQKVALARRPRPVSVPPEVLTDRRGYALVVVNQPANVERRERLGELVRLLGQARRDLPLVWVLERRTEHRLADFGLTGVIAGDRIACLPMQPYPEFVRLLEQATCVFSDSSAVNDEALTLGVPSLGFFEPAERDGSAGAAATIAVGTDPKRVTRALWNILYGTAETASVPVLWDGQAAARIAAHLAAWLRTRSAPAPAPAVTAASFLAREAGTEKPGMSMASEVTK